jgi:hypothetical protein
MARTGPDVARQVSHVSPEALDDDEHPQPLEPTGEPDASTMIGPAFVQLRQSLVVDCAGWFWGHV